MRLLKQLRQSVQHLNHRGYIFVWANLFCLLGMLPLVTAPIAWAGLTYLAYLSATRREVRLEDFWEGVRRYWRHGLIIAALNVLIVGVNLSNLWVYARDPSALSGFLRPVWFITLVIWLTLQLYLWPILHHMTTPTLIGAFRNAGFMILRNPLFTLGIWAVLLVLWSLSTVLAAMWLLLTLSMMSIFLTFAVLDRLGVQSYSESMLIH